MSDGISSQLSNLGVNLKNFFSNIPQNLLNTATEKLIERPENKKIREQVHNEVDSIRMAAVTFLVIDIAVTFFLFFLTSMTGGLFGALLTLGVVAAGGTGALVIYDTIQVCDKVKDLTKNAHHFAKLNLAINAEHPSACIDASKLLIEKAIAETIALKLVYNFVEKWVWTHIKTQAGIRN